jgi:large subunit ribosomal protein L31
MLLYNACVDPNLPLEAPMKPDIHPAYRTVLFHDTAADVFFLIGSTVDTDRTHQHVDGNTYPYVALDVSSASHPVYTGQQRKTQSEGRIAGFNKRFAGFGSSGKSPSA